MLDDAIDAKMRTEMIRDCDQSDDFLNDQGKIRINPGRSAVTGDGD
jgi:hypothetical protein